MVGHLIDLNYRLFFLCYNAHDVSVEFGFVFFWNKVLSTFDGKDDMYVDLGIGVGHIFLTCYTDAAPTGLESLSFELLHKCRPNGTKEQSCTMQPLS